MMVIARPQTALWDDVLGEDLLLAAGGLEPDLMDALFSS